MYRNLKRINKNDADMLQSLFTYIIYFISRIKIDFFIFIQHR